MRIRLLLFLIPLFVFCANENIKAANDASRAEVLIIHDSLPGSLPPGVLDANNVLDLLGHFGLRGRTMSLEEYQPGAARKYPFVFVLAVDARKVSYPRALLSDIRGTSSSVFWVWRHLDELQADRKFAAKLGFRTTSVRPERGFNWVVYKGKTLLKSDPLLEPVEILDVSKVQTVATAVNDAGVSKPYIVHSGSFWYSADSPFAYMVEGDRYLVFCDLLHDFFGIPHREERKALLRLEDISIENDPDELRSMADYLFSRRIPFQISLIPIFKDASENVEIYLSDRPEFVRAIRYMVSKGGVVVMHGVYHQHRTRSADDYEFWDDLANQPIQGDSPGLIEQRIRLGLKECFKNGIYPVTWETPHYMASEVDYRTIAQFFNTSWDDIPSVNNSESEHFFPYTTVDRYGRFIIPESLGFISLERPDPDLLVANAERLQVVRDGVAAFYFHPFMNRDYLVKVLDGIERLGYRFGSIRDYDCRVQMDERVIQTRSSPVRLTLHDQYLHRLLLPDIGGIVQESYSGRPITGTIRDPGTVPPGMVLAMEGVTKVAPPDEMLRLSRWKTSWNSIKGWVRSWLPKESAEANAVVQPQVLVLWDEGAPRPEMNDQKSYLNAFTHFGFLVSTLDLKSLKRGALAADKILVVPDWSAKKLSSAQVGEIEEFVRIGGRVILDGPGALSRALGVETEERSLQVDTVEDLEFGYRDDYRRTRKSTWTPPARVRPFEVKQMLSTYAQDASSEMPVAVVGGHGQGRFLFLGAEFDPTTPFGYTRFPYFIHYVLNGFNVRLPMERPQLELYFDPGISKPNLENMVTAWRKLGVMTLYVAAYQFWPTWEYNYQYLIDLCHKNGILVYAWFELPHVSPKFWQEHPEWRARTVTGDFAGNNEASWRYHMDLDIPECREAAFDIVEKLIEKYPWDGVNIAELNYDTLGPDDPRNYIPMGSFTRSAFRFQSGFDPIELFQPNSLNYWKKNPKAFQKFEAYRAEQVTMWHRTLLEKITPLAERRDMEIIVTMLDSLHSPKVNRETGVDSRQILALMDQFPFTLQVEDPSHLWGGSPDRYLKFGETYVRLVRDRKRLMFDINVFPARDISQSFSPTPTLTGTELAATMVYASHASGRVAIYSEGTLSYNDLEVLSNVLAHEARLQKRGGTWIAQSDRPVLLNLPGAWRSFRLDNQLWPAWDGSDVLVPAGTHRITATERNFRFLNTSLLDLHLVRLTANLESVVPNTGGLEFTYDSSFRALALFNREPFEIRLDGKIYEETPASSSGLWSVRLPSGRHHVIIRADNAATIALDATSLYSSTLIFGFGVASCGMMLVMYLSILARRAIKRASRGKMALASRNTEKS